MKTRLIPLLLMASLVACTSLPRPDELGNLKQIHYGESIPENLDYILVFDAGTDIPLHIQIDGSLIEKGLDEHSSVTLKKTVYTYKKWASLDGIHWFKGSDLVAIGLDLKVPGYKFPHPGQIHLKVDEK